MIILLLRYIQSLIFDTYYLPCTDMNTNFRYDHVQLCMYLPTYNPPTVAEARAALVTLQSYLILVQKSDIRELNVLKASIDRDFGNQALHRCKQSSLDDFLAKK